MCKNRINILLRLLLPVGLLNIILPYLYPQNLIHYIWFPIMYFIGSFIIFLNFPICVEYTNVKPLYLEDLIIKKTEINDSIDSLNKFKKIYIITMTIFLSILISGISEYVIINDIIKNKPVMEILGIIGGNITLYLKIQHIFAKILLKFFHVLKQKEVKKRSLSDLSDVDEIV